MRSIYKSFALPGGLFAGAIVGAGMFSLPYVFARVGFWPGALYVIAIGAVMAIIYGMYADLLITTPGRHNFVSLGRMYLGDMGEWLGVALTVVTMIFVLYIYLILAGRFMGLIVAVPPSAAGIPLWLMGSAAIFFSLRRIAQIEFIAGACIAAIITLLGAWALRHSASFMVPAPFFTPALFWLPIGPLLFSFSGRAATSELVRYAAKKNIVKIIVGTLAVIAVIYIVFAASMLSLTGGLVASDGISELAGLVSPAVAALVGVLGLLALWHVYILLGFDAVAILQTDLALSRGKSRFIAIAVPLMLYFVGSGNFFALIALVGGIFAALENICIILMWFRMRARLGSVLLKRFPHVVLYGLLAVFVIIFMHELTARIF